MIIDGLLAVVSGVINVLFWPLEVVNFAVDILSSITIVQEFLKIVAYLFPWQQITPLIFIVIGFFVFRGVVALIKTIWDLLPLV